MTARTKLRELGYGDIACRRTEAGYRCTADKPLPWGGYAAAGEGKTKAAARVALQDDAVAKEPFLQRPLISRERAAAWQQ
jgi:hypothetical protein